MTARHDSISQLEDEGLEIGLFIVTKTTLAALALCAEASALKP
jgi:hypothetical protein